MNFLTKHLHSQITKYSVTCVGKVRNHQNKRLEHSQFYIVDLYIKFPEKVIVYLIKNITNQQSQPLRHLRFDYIQAPCLSYV